MKFGIYCGNLVPFHGGSLQERALGGTETGVIHLARCLKLLGHEVLVFANITESPADHPDYKCLAEIQKIRGFDVFISVRDWIPCFYEVDARKSFFWTGDSYDQFPNYGIGDKRVSSKIDGFLAVSSWQADQISARSGFPRQKCFIIRNGVDLQLFEGEEKRSRKRLIYSSTPYRGLASIPAFYQALRTKHPELELHVFSGYDVYNRSNQEFEELRSQLESLPGCQIHGNILQAKLAREFMKSAILFYPNTFEETSCITAMEAMAAGCVPLSSALGALPETIGDAGVLIEGRPGEDAYNRSFLEAAHQLLSEDAYFNELSSRAKSRAKNLDWKQVAKDFESFCLSV